MSKKQAHDEYICFLKEVVFKEAKELPGFLSFHIYKQEHQDSYEFLVVTDWTDLRSIKAFAGEDISQAMVPEEAQKMMISYDKEVTHYEIVSE